MCEVARCTLSWLGTERTFETSLRHSAHTTFCASCCNAMSRRHARYMLSLSAITRAPGGRARTRPERRRPRSPGVLRLSAERVARSHLAQVEADLAPHLLTLQRYRPSAFLSSRCMRTSGAQPHTVHDLFKDASVFNRALGGARLCAMCGGTESGHRRNTPPSMRSSFASVPTAFRSSSDPQRCPGPACPQRCERYDRPNLLSGPIKAGCRCWRDAS